MDHLLNRCIIQVLKLLLVVYAALGWISNKVPVGCNAQKCSVLGERYKRRLL